MCICLCRLAMYLYSHRCLACSLTVWRVPSAVWHVPPLSLSGVFPCCLDTPACGWLPNPLGTHDQPSGNHEDMCQQPLDTILEVCR